MKISSNYLENEVPMPI